MHLRCKLWGKYFITFYDGLTTWYIFFFFYCIFPPNILTIMIIFVYKNYILNLAFAFWTRFVIDLICYYP